MAKKSLYEDQYAGFGSLEIKSVREKLIEQVPEQLPEIYLPVEGIDKSAVYAFFTGLGASNWYRKNSQRAKEL